MEQKQAVEPMPIGLILRRLREQKRMTRDNLADKCGMSRFGLANIERGKASPTMRSVFKILDEVGGEMSINGIVVCSLLSSKIE